MSNESCLPGEEFKSFFNIFDALCLELINGNIADTPLLNGCIHEADRLLRLAYEDESLDEETKQQYESLIDDKFYQTYGDCLLIFAVNCRDIQSEYEVASDLSLEMYQNCEKSFVSLHLARFELIKSILNKSLQDDSKMVEFYNSFSIENIQFFYISNSLFQLITTVSNDWLFKQVSTSIQLFTNYGLLNNRLIAQTYFDYFDKVAVGEEEQFEIALDFIEIETEEALANDQDMDSLLCADAIHLLILFKYLKHCASDKIDLIKEKIEELFDEINQNSDQLNCSLPVQFENEKEAITKFLGK